jgi:hypothetical protein
MMAMFLSGIGVLGCLKKRDREEKAGLRLERGEGDDWKVAAAALGWAQWRKELRNQ